MVIEATLEDNGQWAWGLERDQLATQYRAQAGAFRELVGRKAFVRREPPSPAVGPAPLTALQHAEIAYQALVTADEWLSRMLKTRLFGRRPKTPTFPAWVHEPSDEGDSEFNLDKLVYDLASIAGKIADQLDRVRDDQWEREANGPDGVLTVDVVARMFLQEMRHRHEMIEDGYAAIAEHDKEKAKAHQAAQLSGEPEPE